MERVQAQFNDEDKDILAKMVINGKVRPEFFGGIESDALLVRNLRQLIKAEKMSVDHELTGNANAKYLLMFVKYFIFV
jgi:hypothetical protein